ncbi:MAG: universal stress protein [Proteobacteria bacterium]|nr:universal stress protein [Pseudomonadota bacterium]
MPRLLIPFAEPEGAARAVDALLREPRDAALVVHLAAVVEPLRPGKVAMFVSAQRAESMVRGAARRWLAPLEARLAAAGIRCESEVVLGPPRPTIRALAQRSDVDRVMLPPARVGTLGRRDIETIRDLSPHPVTVAA